MWPACGLSEAVAHVEGTGRAGAAAPCGPGLCPCPVGVGATALHPFAGLHPFGSLSGSLLFLYLCLSSSPHDFSLSDHRYLVEELKKREGFELVMEVRPTLCPSASSGPLPPAGVSRKTLMGEEGW